MDVLPAHFGTFRFFGLWYEDLENRWTLKMIYRTFVVFCLVQFMLLQLISAFSSSTSVEEIAESIFVMLTFIVNLYKVIMFIKNRNEISNLLDQFRLEICRVKNITEERILSYYQAKAKSTYRFRMCLTVGSGATFILMPIINTRKIDLPYEMNLFDVSTPLRFAIAYFFQSVPVIFGIVTDVTLDSFFCACIILTCGQLDLCCHRIITDNKNEESVKNYVYHHVLIIKIVHKIQSAFMSSILPVFASALITLCTSVYQLAQVIFIFHRKNYFEFFYCPG